MLYTLGGLAAASIFGIITFSLYGYEGLMNRIWIDYIFWGLIASGTLLSHIAPWLKCLWCRIGDTFKGYGFICRGAPCTH